VGLADHVPVNTCPSVQINFMLADSMLDTLEVEAHDVRVELNIGGYHFETSLQTLRRIPHTYFDAYLRAGRVLRRQHLC
jgi:hypothetical protein